MGCQLCWHCITYREAEWVREGGYCDATRKRLLFIKIRKGAKMADLEEVYDRDIHPLVERISLICRQNQVPMFLTFQDGKESFRNSCLNPEKSQFQTIFLHLWLSETWSFDEFMKRVITDARKNGHNSLFLTAMGIPEKPES
jgi:hypothetical protein